MGCKCANENDEGNKEEEEILKHDIENGNKENNENNNFQKIDEDLLGLNEEQNVNNKVENNNININENNIDEIDPNKKYENYPEKIVELINNIREDPVGYADIVENSIENITSEQDKEDPSINRLIYKKKIKVALTKGESVFHEAIDFLRTLKRKMYTTS